MNVENNNYQENFIGIISRDEMNLAEFPLTVLSTRASSNIKTLEFCDSVQTKNGEAINRRWLITGADKFGLPTSSDDEVLLGILKLTVNDGLKNRKVYFTRYELLKSLHWTTEGRNYIRLQKALDRLSGVRIKATNAFYDNESKTHSTKNFGIIDEYEINNAGEAEGKKSFFVWSDVLFKSFQVGFIKKLNLEFYLNLKSAVSKRLYRYLDKHFWYKSSLKISLFTLAHEKIGISRTYKFASSLRQQLDPALEELITTGFIEKFQYWGRGSASEIIIYAKLSNRSRQNIVNKSGNDVPELNEEQGKLKAISFLLLKRGLAETQIIKILKEKNELELTRIEKIIGYFDSLVASKSKLISRNPIGFLYKAIVEPTKFTLPGESKQGELHLNYKAEKPNGIYYSGKDSPPLQKSATVNSRTNESQENILEARYLIFRKKEIDTARKNTQKDMIKKINEEVEKALAKLKGFISEDKFKEAVEHGVDEKIAKLFAVPDFKEWVREAGKII